MPPAHPRRRPRRRRPPDSRRPPDTGPPARPRRRGAQPGNVNALRHGLYARTLTKAALAGLEQARGLTAHSLTEEIATLRAKLSDLPPSDAESFLAGLVVLVRLVHVDYRMNSKATADLADNLTALLNRLGDELLPPGD